MEIHCPKCGKLIDFLPEEGSLECPFCYEEIKYVEGSGLTHTKKKREPFKLPTLFKGRMGRRSYSRYLVWLLGICLTVIYGIYTFAGWRTVRHFKIGNIALTDDPINRNKAWIANNHIIEAWIVICLVMLLPPIVGRLHDMNCRGWWLLLILSPLAFIFQWPIPAIVVFALGLIVLGFIDGVHGKENRFNEGTDPGDIL